MKFFVTLQPASRANISRELTEREREARLTGLGMSKSLAKRIASGRWDADRQPRREDAANKGANELLAALSSIGKAAESLITKRT